MKCEHSIETLETAQNSEHQWREWRIERVGWGAMLLIVLAALLGYLGPGPLTSREITSSNATLTLDYNAIEHYAAPGCFKIRVAGGTADTLRLVVSRSICDHATAESIVPRPMTVEARKDEIVYTFAVPPSTTTTVLYRYRYDDFAVFDHRIAIDGGESIAFRQYVLP